MKSAFYILVLLASVFAYSCKESDADNQSNFEWSVESDNQEIRLSQEINNWMAVVKPTFEGNITIKITKSSGWKASINYLTEDKGWVNLSKTSGAGAEDIVVSVTENAQTSFRKAYIEVVIDGVGSRRFTITQQDAPPTIDFTPEGAMEGVSYDKSTKELSIDDFNGGKVVNLSLNTNSDGLTIELVSEGDKTIGVKSARSGITVNENTRVDWIDDFSFDEGVISFKTTQNISGSERKAYLRVTYGDLEDYYMVTQGKSLYRNVLKTVDNDNSVAMLEQGSFGTLSKDIELVVESDVELKAGLKDVEVSNDKTDWVSVEKGDSKNLFILKLTFNETDNDRSAVVYFTTNDGSHSEQKPLEWKFVQRMEALDIEWIGGKLDNDNLLFGPTARTGVNTFAVANIRTSYDEIEVSCTPEADWVDLTMKNGKLYLELQKYQDETAPRTTKMTIMNKGGALAREINITQNHTQEIAPKSAWSIEVGNNHTENRSLEDMVDGFLCYKDLSPRTKWQPAYGNSWATDVQRFPYQFVIDLGSSQKMNSLGYWPDIEWPNGNAGEVQFEVSVDKDRWIDMGRVVAGASQLAIQQAVYDINKNGAADQYDYYINNPFMINSDKVIEARYVRFSVHSCPGAPLAKNPHDGYKGEVTIPNNGKFGKVAEIGIWLK